MSHLKDSRHVSLGVGIHVQAAASLAGRADRVTPPAVPRRRQVSVVRQLIDLLAARSNRNITKREHRNCESAASLF